MSLFSIPSLRVNLLPSNIYSKISSAVSALWNSAAEFVVQKVADSFQGEKQYSKIVTGFGSQQNAIWDSKKNQLVEEARLRREAIYAEIDAKLSSPEVTIGENVFVDIPAEAGSSAAFAVLTGVQKIRTKVTILGDELPPEIAMTYTDDVWGYSDSFESITSPTTTLLDMPSLVDTVPLPNIDIIDGVLTIADGSTADEPSGRRPKLISSKEPLATVLPLRRAS